MAIDRAIDRLTAKISGGGSGGDTQKAVNDFIEGKTKVITYDREIVSPFAFFAKPELEEVYLPNATYIGEKAFGGLFEPSMLASNQIEGGVFHNANLRKIDMPNVTNICNYAFENATALQEINLGNSLMRIGAHAFYANSTFELRYLKIPKSVVLIEKDAFSSLYGNSNEDSMIFDMTDFGIDDAVPTAEDNTIFQNPGASDRYYKIIFQSQEVLDKFTSDSVWSYYSSKFKVATPSESE